MTANEMWERFITEKGTDAAQHDAWAFGDDADMLAELVVRGIKTATSSAYALYELEGKELPEAGEYSVILNSQDEAVCIIKTTKVFAVPFNEVMEEHAYAEGEGDRSLDYWRHVHEQFFTEELAQAGLEFTEKMKVVCEEFEVVYK